MTGKLTVPDVAALMRELPYGEFVKLANGLSNALYSHGFDRGHPEEAIHKWIDRVASGGLSAVRAQVTEVPTGHCPVDIDFPKSVSPPTTARWQDPGSMEEGEDFIPGYPFKAKV